MEAKNETDKELVICPHAGFCIDGSTCIHAKFHKNDHRLYGCLGNDRINCPACVVLDTKTPLKPLYA